MSCAYQTGMVEIRRITPGADLKIVIRQRTGSPQCPVALRGLGSRHVRPAQDLAIVTVYEADGASARVTAHMVIESWTVAHCDPDVPGSEILTYDATWIVPAFRDCETLDLGWLLAAWMDIGAVCLSVTVETAQGDLFA